MGAVVCTALEVITTVAVSMRPWLSVTVSIRV